jgi:hypothetical protein
MKKTIFISIILAGLLAGCNSKTTKTTPTNSDSGGTISTSKSSNISNAKTATVTSVTTPIETPAETEVTKPPEKVGDGIFLIEKIPKPLAVEINCTYGSADPTEKVTAYEKTIDFSVLGNESEGFKIPYCVLPDSTVYYATYRHLYKSDTTLTNRELLLEMDENRTDLPCNINNIIKIDNSEFLFFFGSVRTTPNSDKKCLGAFNLKTGEVGFEFGDFSGQSPHYVPCNTGVMVYGGGSGSAWYWENGKITEIVLKNERENDLDMRISANGKYICSFMEVVSNGNLIERYSVYDIATGAFLKSFDWTFEIIIDGGFTFLDINEETKSVYVCDSNNGSNLYQFYFGE